MSYWYGNAKIASFIKQVRAKEVTLTFARSSWPWGQNVNKNDTKVQLFRDANNSLIIPKEFKWKLLERNDQYVTKDWMIRINTEVHRTQKANKEQTLKKLTKVIKNAFKEPKVRKKTAPPKRAVDKRIAEKKRRSKTRSSRKKIVG